MGANWKRRCAAWILSGALAVTGLPSVTALAAGSGTAAAGSGTAVSEGAEKKADMTDLEKDYEELEIVDGDDVRGNLAMVKTGRYGSSIEWTSSDPAVVTDSAGAGSLYDGGVVTRPQAGGKAAEVKLTAVLSKDGEEMTKTFDVKVQPLEADLDTDYTAGYLWTNFDASGGYEKIFLGYSEDGLTWSKLNKVDGVPNPILVNDAEGSDLGVRDPHLIRSAEGDRYWILGTDLHAEGGGAGGSGWNQLSASQNIVVWESTDLVNWSEPRLVYSGFDQAGCVWAPEAIYDDTTGDYVVYWSIRDKSKNNTQENALRVYVCRTRDFRTFSESKVWLSEDQDSGSEVNIIDTTIVKDGGKFYRFSTSDWNTIVDVSDTLDTEDVLDVRNGEEASAPAGSWQRIVTRSGSEAAGFTRTEGYTVYQLPDGRWCAMGDNGGYNAFVTDDLASGKFTPEKATFVDGRFRHGTVVRLSKAEEARVLEAYKEQESANGNGEAPAKKPVLSYDFEQDAGQKTITDTASGNDTKENGTLFGNAKVAYDETRKSNVLVLDGSDNTYAEIPQGFFDKRNAMTISMDVKSELSDGNFFTFAFGKDSSTYDFFRVRGTAVRNAITTSGWESEQEVAATGVAVGEWQNVILVFNRGNVKMYLDGSLVAENTGIAVAALGTDLLSYLGKSFYDGDAYFKGCFDNFKVYNRALDEDEILEDLKDKLDTIPLLKKVVVGTIPENPSQTMGTDSHTAVTSKIDRASGVITSYIRRGTDLSSVPVDLGLLSKNAEVTVDGEPFAGGSLDLTADLELEISYLGKTEKYTLKTPKFANNPVLPGQYADPDIDYFDGKYWLYPTTDGYSGWSGTVFHAWSSKNMLDWEDEGVILDVANKDPGLNEKGVQIASSAWSDGNAWAPTIEEKNGKYYFYYCGNINSSYTGKCGTNKAIGVAVADDPAGPFVAEEMPIVYPKLISDAGVSWSGQVIDPSIFTDDDGTVYLFFGNGANGTAMVELNDDMVTAKPETLKRINGMTDFRESVVVFKRNGLYHFTWSCDDANSPNYHVNYGTAEKLDGNVTYHYTLLQKDESGDMLGTAHQSVVYNPDTGKYYMAYHRFYTPLGIYTEGLGVHRTTCIEEITFDEKTGLMNPIKPTMEGPVAQAQAKLDKVVEEADLSAALGNGTVSAGGKLSLPAEINGAKVSWKSGNASVISDDGTVSLPKTDTEVRLTATFEMDGALAVKSYTVTVKGTGFILTYKAGKGGKIASDATQAVPYGQDGKPVTAVADPGYRFVKWSDGVTTATRVDKKIQADLTVTAQFAEDGTGVKSVSLNAKKLTLGVKETFQLKASVKPKNVSAAAKKTTWKSDKPGVASVKNGKVTAKKKGTAKITATAGGKSVSCTVTVKKAPNQVKLNVKKKTLKKGKSFKLKVKLPKGTAGKVTFTSSKKKVAAVSASGKVTAKKKGKAKITAKTYNGKKATVVITVK